MNNFILAHVIWEKARLNLKSEASVNYLSYCWWIIEPITHMACYYVIFELLLQRGGPDFVYFLMVGLVFWLWFAKTVTQGAGSLVGGSGLMNQRQIPKVFFPLVFIVQATVKQTLVIAILLMFLILAGFSPGIEWLGIIPLVLVQLLFMIPVSMILALVLVYVRDFKYVIPTFIQFMFFGSGIFYSFDRISSEYKDYFLINPMAGLIKEYRNVLLHQQWPDWLYLGSVAGASVFLFAVILTLYVKKDRKIARIVSV
jgi:lipopolysaccharide transport system permease protein|tara:strand:+ start:498 stop:1265 length:768 start_codon:yes stop_codon:yes gene_type:complete